MIPNIPLICIFIAIIAFFYASYTDLKSGLIQNKITLPLIGLGITLNAIYAIMVNDAWFIIINLIFIAIIYIISVIFWKWGIWGGGVAKLATALASLVPVYLSILNPNYNVLGVEIPIDVTYGFTFTIMINSILFIISFLLIYVLFSWIRESIKPEFENKENKEPL